MILHGSLFGGVYRLQSAFARPIDLDSRTLGNDAARSLTKLLGLIWVAVACVVRVPKYASTYR